MVIQRLQNLYLFLSAVLMTVFAYVNVFFVDVANIEDSLRLLKMKLEAMK